MPAHVSRRAVLGTGLAAAVPAAAPAVALPAPSAGADAPGPSAPRVTDPGAYVSFAAHRPHPGAFPLVGAPVLVDDDDHPGVVRAAADLRADIARVTGVRPAGTVARRAVLVGTLGRSRLVDSLAASGKLDTTGVRGRWETSLQTVVDHPCPASSRPWSSRAATRAARSSAPTTSPTASVSPPGTGGTTCRRPTTTASGSCPAATPRAPRP